MATQWTFVRRKQAFQVAGRTIELAALTIGDYAEVSRQALDWYRRERVRAWTVAAEALPEDERKRLISEAVHKAAEISESDLPIKDVEIVLPDGTHEWRRMDYASWWASETMDGRLFCFWLSMRACPGQEHVTIEDVSVLFSQPDGAAEKAASVLLELSESGAEVTAETQVDPNLQSRREAIREARRRKREERRRRRGR